jgi:subtilisin family serine protease
MKKSLSLVLAGITLIFVWFVSVGQVNPPGNANAPGRKIVVFMNQVAPAAQDAMIARAGANKIKDLPLVNAAVVMATPAAERVLARSNGVAWVEDDAVANIVGQVDNAGKPAGKPTPPPPQQKLPWGVDRIDAELAWGASTGNGVKVAVVDTGIDLTHPDLGVVVDAYNAINSRKSANDDNGHGSHVAGIIAARNNSLGVVGVAPMANLYAVKVLNVNGIGWVSDIAEGIQWCIDNDIQVINMSLTTTSDVQLLHDVVHDAADAGIIIVAAAGNSDGPVEYPAAYESVIAVSATGLTDENLDYFASFSNRGPEIDLAAPGVSIRSTYKGGGYAIMSGTSMASPHVAGVAALILGINGSADVSNLLQESAEDLGDDDFDQLYGNGLVNAEAATILVPPPQPK